MQTGESPSRKRRRTEMYEVMTDHHPVEPLSTRLRFPDLNIIGSLVAQASNGRSPPELVRVGSPGHQSDQQPDHSVNGWSSLRTGAQVSLLQISPPPELEVTTTSGASGVLNGRNSRNSNRLSQLSPVFVVNGSSGGVAYIGQVDDGEPVVVPESDLIELSSADLQQIQPQPAASQTEAACSLSNRRSVITHGISASSHSTNTNNTPSHDRNNNPLNDNFSVNHHDQESTITSSEHYPNGVIPGSPSEELKHLHHNYSGQSSTDSLTDSSDTQSMENASQISDSQSIDSTAATIDSTSEASLAVFRGPVATTTVIPPNSADLAAFHHHYRNAQQAFQQQQHQQQQSSQQSRFVDEAATTAQILQLQAAAFRERSQSTSSQNSSSSPQNRSRHNRALIVQQQQPQISSQQTNQLRHNRPSRSQLNEQTSQSQQVQSQPPNSNQGSSHSTNPRDHVSLNKKCVSMFVIFVNLVFYLWLDSN